MKKNQLVMVANLQGIPMTKYNLQKGSGIKFVRIPKVKIGRKRNIYA